MRLTYTKKRCAGVLALLLCALLLSLAACGTPSGSTPGPAASPTGSTPLPAEPVQSPGPAQSTEPSEPSAPAQSAEPVQSPEPAQPSEPVQSPEPVQSAEPPSSPAPEEPYLAEDGSYTSKEDVALYIHLYGCLPGNFITKKQAEALGWSGGSLEPYAPGKCIGGNRFGNYEGLLPSAEGRTYTECDIDTLGARSRGAKRIVFSNDGLIYYTEDHYESFELLYGDDSFS